MEWFILLRWFVVAWVHYWVDKMDVGMFLVVSKVSNQLDKPLIIE